MIRLLFKVIHYEPSPDHKDNVMRSFNLIWILLSTLPAGLIYLIYKRTPEKNEAAELLFFASEILVIGLIYYIIVTRKSKVFIESEVGTHYFKFGKFTNVLKPLVLLMTLGVIIILGRVMFVLWR